MSTGAVKPVLQMQLSNEQLDKLQRDNLEFCETWAKAEINGINVIPAMSYFLIQILNNITLQMGLK